MPSRQNTEAVKMRRLKKADCEVDFFFIDEVGVSLRSRVAILSDTPETCQHFFKFLTKFYPRTRLCRTATYAPARDATNALPVENRADDRIISGVSHRRSVFL